MSVQQSNLKYRDDVWNDINNLLSHLRALGAVDLIRTHYSKYGNPAPPEMVERVMKRLQTHLDSVTPLTINRKSERRK